MANHNYTVSELASAAGQDLGASQWHEITQDRIDLFADATNDHQWIHIDADKAAEGPFGITIAHGYLTLSLVPKLLEDVLEITDQVRGTNYGIERLRFTDVVPAGSRIRIVASLGEVEVRSDGGVRYAVDTRVEREGSERPVLIGRLILLSHAESPDPEDGFKR